MDARPSQNWTACKNGDRSGPTMADWRDGVMENWSDADGERLPRKPTIQQPIAPFLAAGKAELCEYKCVDVQSDEKTGLFSDEAVVNCAP